MKVAITGNDLVGDIGAGMRIRKIAALPEKGTKEVDRVIRDGDRHCRLSAH
jgi:hypothetical protein